MTDLPYSTPAAAAAAPRISRTGVLFAALGAAGLALPLVQFKPNRIVAGEGMRLPDALPAALGWGLTAALVAALLAGLSPRLALPARLALGLAGLLATVVALGVSAGYLMPEGNTIARVAPSAGFWLLTLAFALMVADAQSRMHLPLRRRWLMLGAAIVSAALILSSGLLDGTSVMREYAARADLFGREAVRHLLLAFGSLGLALVVGLPLGIALYNRPGLRGPVLGTLNLLQTIPSLALFGIMIPLLGWVALHLPGAQALGVSGIGPFPALIALFIYSLLPVVSNTVVGLAGVSPEARDAAVGTGMTERQILTGILLPLALPSIIAAVRIVLVQNIGLAVIAGLIGGGGFGTFVFQGLNQTAMDLVLLGALPTIALALVSGVSLDLAVEGLERGAASRGSP
ncbi:ABC transporter permease [Paracoccus suum]|uniref:ABC transporter permease n=1 Tax=Paracoccus suum TaxID=2259340 RepID=A0A344PMS5_9RHOB|nr:ABC transporter permease [Paracoccus suum]AXC50680.1 ABC transporter permease [Paracoccus suum]